MAIQVHFVNPNPSLETGRKVTDLVVILATKKLKQTS